jgi:hypothetical protein
VSWLVNSPVPPRFGSPLLGLKLITVGLLISLMNAAGKAADPLEHCEIVHPAKPP